MTENKISFKQTLKELQEINKKHFQEQLEKDSTKIAVIKTLLFSIKDIQEIKKLQTIIDDVFWNKYVESKGREFFLQLVNKEFRATFGYLKNTIKIISIYFLDSIEVLPHNSSLADHITLIYMVNSSPMPQKASFKDLVIQNHVDFTAPILKDGI